MESKMEQLDIKENDGEKKDKDPKPKKDKEPKQPKQPKQPKPQDNAAAKKTQNRDGMEVTKAEDFGAWYSQVVVKSEMIEFYDISGCYILRPWSYFMWDKVRDFFDIEIKKMGIENAYFPLFVSQARLEAEKDHVAGFSPEVAWVTRSGQSELEEPIAVRPTSETVMYPSYSKWIRSYRDLPLRINQWSNVVRWEFKHPTPFIRSREFLWQEGHTAFATQEEAGQEVLEILRLYQRVYEELLAVPVIRGFKSENEKFAGGLYTTTIEGFVPGNGRSVQAATSHCLGQNFAKMFDIMFEDDKGGKQYAWQNSWGLTTRSLGVMTMVHGDDVGLVLPPRVAPVQVIIVPIGKGEEPIVSKCNELMNQLKQAGIRCKVEDRKDKTAGWKFNHWELKGVPIRMELGPRDLENNVVVCAKRFNGEKCAVSMDNLIQSVQTMLDEIQTTMLEQARKERDSRVKIGNTWEEFMKHLEGGNVVLCPWCTERACEDEAKKRSGIESKTKVDDAKALSGAAKTLCMPLDEELQRLNVPDFDKETTTCFACSGKAVKWCLWGRSY